MFKKSNKKYYITNTCSHSTYKIFKLRDPEADKAQELLLRLLHGGLKSPNNIFDYDYESERDRQIHKTNAATDYCEECGVLCETTHILFGCLNCLQEQTKLFQEINNFLEEERKKINNDGKPIRLLR